MDKSSYFLIMFLFISILTIADFDTGRQIYFVPYNPLEWERTVYPNVKYLSLRYKYIITKIIQAYSNVSLAYPIVS